MVYFVYQGLGFSVLRRLFLKQQNRFSAVSINLKVVMCV